MNDELTTKFLSGFAEAALEIRAHIRAAGFSSIFVDLDWMRANSNDEEWEDLLNYERAYAREVVFSSDVSSIRFSDPDEYPWVTEFFEKRARERFNRHGAVNSLFFDLSRSHLIELTVARQRLSQAARGLTEEGIEARDQRYAMFERARAEELVARSGYIAESRAWWSSREVTLQNLYEFFSSSFRETSMARGANGFFINFPLKEGLQLGFEFRPRLNVVRKRVEGAFIPKFYLRADKPFSATTPPAKGEFLPLAFALPNAFIDYEKFESKEDFALSATAWRCALGLLVEALGRRGWLTRT